jgi:hypothetical protein
MKRAKLFLIGVFAVFLPMLMAPSGGFPSRPTFSSGTSTGTGGAGGIPSFKANAAIPSVIWNSPGNGVDQKQVQCYWNGGALQYNCTFVNDAGSAEHTFLSATRGTATAVTGVAIGNLTDSPTVTINGKVTIGPIVCTTACSLTGMVVGQTAIITKTSNTSRASTTTTTADPDLVFTNVPNGTYHIWYTVNFSSGAGGVRMSPVLSGAYNFAGAQNCFGVAAGVSTFSSSGVTVCNSTSGLLETSQGTGTASGANAIAIFWAQSSSNVANTTLVAGSDIIVQRIQ